MLNRYGVCESAMRRAEQVRECPHDRMHETVRRRKNAKK